MKTEAQGRPGKPQSLTLGLTRASTAAAVACCASMYTSACGARPITTEITIVFDGSCEEVCRDVIRGGANTWNLQAGTNISEIAGKEEVTVHVSDNCGPDAAGHYMWDGRSGTSSICLHRDIVGTPRGRSTAIHELGHSMGLNHVSEPGHIMSAGAYGACLSGADIAEFCSVHPCNERQFSCDR